MLPDIYIVHLSPSLPQRDLQPFTRVTEHWRRGNKQSFWGLLDTGSELTPILGDSKCDRSIAVRTALMEVG